MEKIYLDSIKKQFSYYQKIGRTTIDRLSEQEIFWRPNEDTNSIAIIVCHLAGNMKSRWTDFRTTDGEKTWRHRDSEFEIQASTKSEILKIWEDGWEVLHDAIDSIKDNELETEIFIRNMGQPLVSALNRQLAHYPYHVGQIVHIAKEIKGAEWKSLSIPKGKSDSYNKDKFSQPKMTKDYTDDMDKLI